MSETVERIDKQGEGNGGGGSSSESVEINLTLGATRQQISKTIAQNINFSKITPNTTLCFEAYYNNVKYSIAYRVVRFGGSKINIATCFDINNSTSSEIFAGEIENSNDCRWQRAVISSNNTMSWSNVASEVMYASGVYTSPKCTVIY